MKPSILHIRKNFRVVLQVEKGLIIFLIIMGWTLLIYGELTFLVVKKKDYFLLSGFANRPEEEQAYLKQNGYIEAVGKLLMVTFSLLALSFLLGVFSVPYGFEVGMAIFLIVLLAGTLWLQRYEVPRKRKRNYWLIGIITGIIVIFIAFLSIFGYQENDMVVVDNTLVIEGMYGDNIPIDQINKVEKIDQLPEITAKTNGFAMSNRLKGKFLTEKSEESIRLFIAGKSSYYVTVETEEGLIIFNRENESELDKLYQQLQSR